MHLPQPTILFLRQRGWDALKYQQSGFTNAARQDEQEATAQRQADMLHESSRIEEQVAENTVSNQQVEIVTQLNSIAENAVQGQRRMLMSEACAELQHRDENTSSSEFPK